MSNAQAPRLHRILFASTFQAAASLVALSQSLAASCEDLKSASIKDTTIVSAESVAAGDFTGADKVTRTSMPAFCRVVASVKSAPDSDIGVEIWLPRDWKGVFHANGNGGYSGILAFGYDGMEVGIKRGYASASTDMGTAPANPLNGDALVGHPQKWKDWGLLSTHVMADVGKQIEKAYYGADPKHAYYTGCSTGGQQGIIEAQYYPDDFNGILIGAPVINRTWGHAAVLWDYLAANLQPNHKLSDDKLSLLTKTAVAACGANHFGLKSDPFIADPRGCDFDPAALVCKSGQSGACLTRAEAETAKAFYTGPLDARTGNALYYGWLPGSEAGSFNWGFLEAPSNAPNEPSFDGLFKWVLGADWNWRDFSFERDMPKVDAALGPSLNGAMTGDVSKFRASGGKMIIFQGWADPIVSPGQTIDFYTKLAKQFGGDETQNFARLFMAPGVGHCGGGAGPNSFNSSVYGSVKPAPTDRANDLFTALSRWVEDGAAPTQVVATKYVDDAPAKGVAMQRPLCPYPLAAQYKGTGDANAAASFVCAAESN